MGRKYKLSGPSTRGFRRLYFRKFTESDSNERRESNIEGPSCNHYCSGKAISIAYSEFVSVALGIQHVMHMRRDSTCGLSGSATFFHILHKRHDFREKVNP